MINKTKQETKSENKININNKRFILKTVFRPRNSKREKKEKETRCGEKRLKARKNHKKTNNMTLRQMQH